MVRRQVGHGLRQHRRARRDRRGRSPATARSARSGRSTCPPTRNGVRAGIAELAPHLLGEDPRELGKLNRRMDAALKGHPYVKSGDRHGLLGHPRQGGGPAGLRRCWAAATARTSSSTARSRRSRPRRWPASVAGYRAEGYRRFQLKVGGDPDVDIERIRAVRPCSSPATGSIADANTGWLMHDATARRPGGARRGRLHRAAVPHATRSAWRSAGTPTIRSCSTR